MSTCAEDVVGAGFELAKLMFTSGRSARRLSCHDLTMLDRDSSSYVRACVCVSVSVSLSEGCVCVCVCVCARGYRSATVSGIPHAGETCIESDADVLRTEARGSRAERE